LRYGATSRMEIAPSPSVDLSNIVRIVILYFH
jgi:hypothetical protein